MPEISIPAAPFGTVLHSLQIKVSGQIMDTEEGQGVGRERMGQVVMSTDTREKMRDGAAGLQATRPPPAHGAETLTPPHPQFPHPQTGPVRPPAKAATRTERDGRPTSVRAVESHPI